MIDFGVGRRKGRARPESTASDEGPLTIQSLLRSEGLSSLGVTIADLMLMDTQCHAGYSNASFISGSAFFIAS
jgi:hypothetical protein